MESDIVEQARKRAISYRECGPSAEHTASMLDELVFQIERLRADLAAAIKQRDEARELHCRQIAYDLFRTTGVFDPQQVAIKRGWAGLFRVNEPAPREKEGGGA